MDYNTPDYSNFLNTLQSPTDASQPPIDRLRKEQPDYFLSSDGKTPMSDIAVVKKLATEGQIAPEDFDAFQKYMGVDKTGLVDEIAAGTSDSLASFDNLASNATPALVGRIAQQHFPKQINDFLGVNQMVDENLAEYAKQEQMLAETSESQAPKDIESIKTVGDFLRYTGNMVGNTAASVVEAVPAAVGGAVIGGATAGLGGAMAGAAAGAGEAFTGGALIKQGLKQAVKSAAGNLMAEGALASKAAQTGAKAGAMASLLPILPASVDQSFLARGIDSPLAAGAAGLAQIPIEFITEIRAMQRLYPALAGQAGEAAIAKAMGAKALGKDLIKTLGKEAVTNAPMEGATEAVQKGIEELAASLVSDSGLMTPEVTSRVVNAFVGGAIGSLGLSTGSAVAQTGAKAVMSSKSSGDGSVMSRLGLDRVSPEDQKAADDAHTEVIEPSSVPNQPVNVAPPVVMPNPSTVANNTSDVTTPEKAAQQEAAKKDIQATATKAQDAADKVADTVTKQKRARRVAKLAPATQTSPVATPNQAVSSYPSFTKDMGSPKPRRGNTVVPFTSDMDKALYIVANKSTKSAADSKFMNYIKKQHPEWSDADIRNKANEVKRAVGVADLSKPLDPIVQKAETTKSPAPVPVTPVPADEGFWADADKTKGTGAVVELGDEYGTRAVKKAGVASADGKPRVSVMDFIGGNPAGTATAVETAPDTVELTSATSVPSSQEFGPQADSFKKRGFLRNTLKALGKMGYSKVKLPLDTLDAKAAVSRLVGDGSLTVTDTPGVYKIMDENTSAQQKHAAARDKVVSKGNADGFEHVVVTTPEGDEIAYHTLSKKNSVNIPGHVTADVVPQGFIVHHNHPGNLSLSTTDLITQRNGFGQKMGWVIAHGNNGSFYAGRVNPQIDKARIANLPGVYAMMVQAVRELKGTVPSLVWDDVAKTFDANFIDMVNKALASARVIEYITDRPDLTFEDKYSQSLLKKINSAIKREVVKYYGRIPKNAQQKSTSNFNGGYTVVTSSESGMDLVLSRNQKRSGDDSVYNKADGKINKLDGEIKTNLLPTETLPISSMKPEDLNRDPIADLARYEKTMRQVREAVRQVAGDSVAVEFYNDISARGTDGQLQNLRGYQFRNVVAVALGLNQRRNLDALETAYHEAFHYIFPKLSQADRTVIEAQRDQIQKYVKRNMRKIYGIDMADMDLNPFGAEEIAALGFGLYAKRKVEGNETVNSGFHKVFNKILSLLKQIGNIVSGNGYAAVDDLFGSVFNGDYASNGKISGDTAIKMQQSLAEENNSAIQKALQRRYESPSVSIINDASVDTVVSNFVKDRLDAGIPRDVTHEYSNLAVFFNAFKSIPGIARTNPLVAQVHGMLRKIQEELTTVQSDFEIDLNKVLSRGPAALTAAKSMDYLNSQSVPYSVVSDDLGVPRVQFVDAEGKTIRLSMEASSAFFDLDASFKKVLDMWTASVLADVPEDVRTRESFAKYVDEKVAEGTATEADIKRVEVLDKIERLKTSNIPYFPQMRFGDYGVSVHKINPETGKKEMVGLWLIEKDLVSMSGDVNKKQEAAVLKQIKQKYGGLKGHEISSTFKLTHNDVKRLFNGSKLNAEEIVSSLVGDDLGSWVSQELGIPVTDAQGKIVDIKDQLLSDKDFMSRLSKKFDRSFGDRVGYDGYSTDYARVIDSYLKTAPRQLVQAKHRRSLNKLRVGITGSQYTSKIKDDMLSLIDYSLNPRSDWGWVRAVNFGSTLGLNVASSVLQLTTLGTQLPATMMQWKRNPVACIAEVTRAGRDAGKILDTLNREGILGLMVGKKAGGDRLARFDTARALLKDILTDDEISLLRRLYAEGDILPVVAQNELMAQQGKAEFSNKALLTASNYGNKVMNVLAGPMSVSEQFSRLTAALATWRSLNNVHPDAVSKVLGDDENFNVGVNYNLLGGLSPEVAVKYAAVQNTIDNTHAIFGKSARNWNQRGFYGALPFAFMNFPIQAMEYMVHFSKRALKQPEARAGFAYLIASMFFMGGLAGMPAWDLFKDLFEKMYYLFRKEKIDLNYEIKDVLKNSAMLPSPVVNAIAGGVPGSALGVDIGSRMSIPFFWQGLLGGAIKGEMAVTDAMGVQGGLLNNMVTNYKKWQRGDQTLPEAALLGVSPVFVRNAYTSLVGWPSEGVRTGRGSVLISPDDVRMADQLKKAVGLSPQSVSDAQQAEYATSLKMNGSKEHKSNLTSQLANLKFDIYQQAKQGGDVQDLRADYNKKYQELLEFVRRSEGGLSARSVDGLKSSIDQKFQSMKNPNKEVNKKKQREADKIRETLGLKPQ